jgi:hypothetical protein
MLVLQRLFSGAGAAVHCNLCEMTGICHMPMFAEGLTNYHKFYSCNFRELALRVSGREGAQIHVRKRDALS